MYDFCDLRGGVATQFEYFAKQLAPFYAETQKSLAEAQLEYHVCEETGELAMRPRKRTADQVGLGQDQGKAPRLAKPTRKKKNGKGASQKKAKRGKKGPKGKAKLQRAPLEDEDEDDDELVA